MMATSSSDRAAVVVLGMHRSGTSLVARMLEAGGVYFGSHDDLAGPAADNPRGFWEHTGLRSLNEDILRALGADWRDPPTVSEFRTEEMDNLRTSATALLDQLRGAAPRWGWKDPRTTLVLPFWRDLLRDELRTVFCLRHPEAVAASLHAREKMPRALAHFLWRHYAASAIRDLADERVLVVSYEALLRDPMNEARRIAAAVLGDPATHVRRMAEAIEPELATNQAPAGHNDELGTQSVRIYRQLEKCSADRLAWSELTPEFPARDSVFAAMMSDSARLAHRLTTAENVLEHRTREVEQVAARAMALDHEASELRKVISDTSAQLEEARSTICEGRVAREEVERARQVSENERAQLQRTLDEVLQSKGWRLLNRLRTWKIRILGK